MSELLRPEVGSTEGQSTLLQELVSLRGIILVDTHFVPFAFASAIFCLKIKKMLNHVFMPLIHLVKPLSLFGASPASGRARRPRAPLPNFTVD